MLVMMARVENRNSLPKVAHRNRFLAVVDLAIEPLVQHDRLGVPPFTAHGRAVQLEPATLLPAIEGFIERPLFEEAMAHLPHSGLV